MKKKIWLFTTLIFELFTIKSVAQAPFFKTVCKDYCVDVIQKPDSGYIVLSEEDGGFDEHHILNISGELYVAGFNLLTANGDSLLSKCINAGIPSNNYRDGVLLNDAPYYLVGGVTFGSNFILKFDNDGDTIWYKNYYFPNSSSYYEYIYSIKKSLDSAYICLTDFRCFKINQVGDTIWSFMVDTLMSSSTFFHSLYQNIGTGQFGSTDKFLITTADTGFVIFKNVYDAAFTYQKFRGTKYDANRNIIWVKDYFIPKVSSIILTSDSSLMITANDSTVSQSYVIKLDANADLVWTKHFPYEQYNSIEQTADSGFILACGWQFKIIRTDINADTLWTNVLFDPDSTNNGATHARETLDGGYIVCGYKDKLPYFTSSGYWYYWGCISSAVVVKTDNSGNNVAGIIDNDSQNNLYISPNPATSAVTISDLRFTISKIEIYNVMGEKVFEKRLMSDDRRQTISVADFKPGVYFVKLIGEQGSVTRKIVVQR